MKKYKECMRDWKQWGQLRFDPDNYWWKKYLEMMKKAIELVRGDFYVLVPGIMENADELIARMEKHN